jgi:hypothetical protein
MAIVLGVVAAAAVTAVAQGGFKLIKESLIGYEESPSVSTAAGGQFDARISNDESQIDWQLSYSDGVPLHESWQWPRGNTAVPGPTCNHFWHYRPSRRQPEHPCHGGGEDTGPEYGRVG